MFRALTARRGERSHSGVYYYVTRFVWDRHNVGHVARHGLRPAEVEAALADPDRAPLVAHRGPAGEARHGAVCRTPAGRSLAVFWTVRGGAVRVATARPAKRRTERPLHPRYAEDAEEERDAQAAPD